MPTPFSTTHKTLPLRRCFTCATWKPLSCFWVDKSRLRGRSYQCRACKQTEAVHRREKDQQRYRRRYYEQNIKKYGLDQAGFERLLAAQGGKCAICACPEIVVTLGTRRRLCLDHDHKTGKVRGLLCMRCNRGLGYFNDSVDQLRKAADYITLHADEHAAQQLTGFERARAASILDS